MGEFRKTREVKETEPSTDTLRRIINIIFSLAGIILLFRFVFLLFGANPDNQFVDLIYSVTEPYVGIFSGIFTNIDWARGVFEPATLIGLVVLFIVSWLIQSIFAKRTVRREEYTATDRTTTDHTTTEQTADTRNNQQVRKEKHRQEE